MSGGGGGGQTTQVQKADPWAGAQPYLSDAYSMAQTAAHSTPTTAYTGNFVNPSNQTQQQALGMAQNAVGTLSGGQGVLDVANQSLSGQMLTANPYVQQAIDATIRPTLENARDFMLPGIGTAAGEAGAFGGTRQAFLQAQTVQDVNQQVANTAAQMWNQNYQNERNIQTQVAPQMLQIGNVLQMAPAQAMLEVGNQQYALDDLVRQNQQMQFEDEINRYWRAVNPYIAALSGLGMPGGSSSVTATGAGTNSNAAIASGAVGGAAAGVPLAGATYGLSIPIGALVGAAGGYFGSR
jgi:hypothetical protein